MNLWNAVMTWEKAPPLGRLPVAIGRAALSGIAIGPVFALVMLLLVKPDQVSIVAKPEWWLYSFAIGAVFATSFYVTCSLPQTYVTPLIRSWPVARSRMIRAMIGAAGGMAGLLLAFFLLQNMIGITIVNLQYLNLMLAGEAVLGAAIALLIGASVQRDIREKELRAAAATAQAKALQAQINPHFFFNTLNTIQSLIDSEPRQAKEVIGLLSSMFRYTFSSSLQPLVSLSDELEFVRHYLGIESARFGDRLRYTLPQVKDDFQLPGMIVQPLVENAVKHGIAKNIQGGEVRVSIAASDRGRTIMIENPSDQQHDLSDGNLFQPGHALQNIRERLDLAYAGRAAVSAKQEGGMVRVTVVLPR
jgi:sensor histidine kinase YesM